MNSCRLIALLIAVAIVPSGHAAQDTKEATRPPLYNDVSSGSSAIDREAEKAYAGKFRVIETTHKDGFTSSMFKGSAHAPFKDPRPTSDQAAPGKIVFVFVVTPEGRVIEPRILHSTDERVSKYIMNRITHEQYVPARFRGTPVHSIVGDQIPFGAQATRSRN